MGITYIEGTVTGPEGSRGLNFLVDSGATYTLLPYDIWQAIGLMAKTLSFIRFSRMDPGLNGGFRNVTSNFPWAMDRALSSSESPAMMLCWE